MRTRCQPGPGSSGGSTVVYSSGPTRAAAAGANADAIRASPIARPTVDLQRLHPTLPASEVSQPSDASLG